MPDQPSLQDQQDATMQSDQTLEQQLAAAEAGATSDQAADSPEDQGPPSIADQVGTPEDPGTKVPDIDDTPGEQQYINRSDIHASRPPSDYDSPQPPPEQQQTAPEAIDDDLLQTAMAYGMTPEQARGFGDAQSLRNAIVQYDRQLLQQQQTYFSGQPGQQTQAAPPAQEQQQAATTQQQQPVDASAGQQPDDDLKPFEIDEIAVDSDTRQVLEGMQNHYLDIIRRVKGESSQLQQRLAQTEQYVQAVYQQQQQEQARQFVRQFDSVLSELDGAETRFGKGPTEQLNPYSAEARARQEVMQTAAMLINAHAQQGRQLDVRTATKSAIQLVYPDQLERSAERRVTNQLRNRQGQFIARPTQRRDQKPISGEERAMRRMDEYAKAAGLYGDTEEIDVL